jgi:HD-GYP domain-containing protein (c-di-GMP phosphodiesterase class II)
MDISRSEVPGRPESAEPRPAADRGIYLETITALARAVEVRDQYTGEHVRRVGRYSRRIGQALQLSEEQLWSLQVGGVLHDVGKIGVPDAVLGKDGPLNQEEWVALRRHPEIGHALLIGVVGLGPALEAVLHHHERWDGAGYPAGLAEGAIPLAGRVVAVADAFDAMTTPRPYRPRLELRAAVREIVRQRGHHFDPDIVAAFLDTLPRGLAESAWPAAARRPPRRAPVAPPGRRPAAEAAEPPQATLRRALRAALDDLPELPGGAGADGASRRRGSPPG